MIDVLCDISIPHSKLDIAIKLEAIDGNTIIDLLVLKAFIMYAKN